MADDVQLAEGRKNDGYLIVVQDNAAQALTILQANDVALSRLGYAADELVGRKLEVVLDSKTSHVLADDLEFEDDAPDMADILSRHREIRLRERTGGEFTIPVAVHRVMAEDRNPRFQLIIPNERDGRAREHLREMLRQNMDGHTQLDPVTGLPNRDAAEAYLRIAATYMSEAEKPAAFAVLRLDRYQKSLDRYGEEGVTEQLKHIARVCRTSFRSEDVICHLGGPYLGLLLIDLTEESARMVLNRLRWNIRNHRIEFGGKGDFSVTVSIAFGMLRPENSGGLLAAVEHAVKKLGADERNILLDHAGEPA